MSESIFYHAFDKLLKTSRSPRSLAAGERPRNELAIDTSVATIYAVYDPYHGGFVNVRVSRLFATALICSVLLGKYINFSSSW